MSCYYRTPTYLSPSSYKMWCDNRIQFYLNYLSPKKPPRDPQNHHMAVGSAFDAYAKSHLHKAILNDSDPAFEFQTLFEAQVEPQCRDTALKDGRIVFEAYKASGALAELVLTLGKTLGKPRFESRLEGIVDGTRPSVSKRIGAVPLLGKPDLFFKNLEHIRVILDWKVNGYYSVSGISPAKGYVRIYPSWDAYKDVKIEKIGNIRTAQNYPLCGANAEWAAQLVIYGWILGEPVGTDCLTMIHQIVCRPGNIRIAEHCSKVTPEFQHRLFEGLQECWYRIQDGLIFDDMDAEQSLAFAQSLDKDRPDDNALSTADLLELASVPHWVK